MPTVEQLGQRVKAKHPGAYDDMPDVDVGRKVKAKYPGAYDDFTDETPSNQVAKREVPKQEPSIVGDFLSGAGSGLASTVVHGGDLIRRGLGMERIIDKPDVQELMRAPDSTAGTIGRFAEGVAEFAVPLSKVSKALAGERLLARVGGEGLAGGAVGALQSGGDPISTLAGFYGGAAAPLAVPAAKGVMSLGQWLARKPLAQAVVNSVPVVGPLGKAVMKRVGQGAVKAKAPVPVAPGGVTSAEYYAQQGAAAAPPSPAPVQRTLADLPAPAQRPRDARGRFLSPEAKPKPAPVSSIDEGRPLPPQTEAEAGAAARQFNADVFGVPKRDNPLASRTFAPTLADVSKRGKVESISRELSESLGDAANAPLAPKSSAATKITQARLNKSEPLGNHLTKRGFDPVALEDVPHVGAPGSTPVTDAFWKSEAKAAGVNPPTSEESWLLILASMKRASNRMKPTRANKGLGR